MDPKSFIGPKEVASVEDIQEKQNGTIDLVKVTYADQTTETITKRLYDASVTSEATDLTALRERRLQPIVTAILELLLEWGVGLSDINFITQSISLSVNSSMNFAATKLWGKTERELTLLDLDKVLKSKTTLQDILPPQ